jgi:hypothetical protein
VPSGGGAPRERRAFKTQDKPDEVRRSNLSAAKAVSDAIRTSLGPKGMDKMVRGGVDVGGVTCAWLAPGGAVRGAGGSS